MFEWLKSKEDRATVIPNDSGIATSDPRIRELFGLFGLPSAAGVTVTEDTALGVPAIWAAVNLISSELAEAPLMVFRRSGDGRERVRNTSLARVLHDQVNPEMSSFGWRKYLFERILTTGRGLTYIERNSAGQVVNLWPMDPTGATIERKDFRTTYAYSDGMSRRKVYEAQEVIDIPFMLRSDGISHRSPLVANKDVIGLAIAVTQWGARFFANGGVPPFAVSGNFQSAASLNRAGDDLEAAVKKAASEGRSALTLPAGLTIDRLGANPEDMQMVEVKRFLVEEIARIFSVQPVLLQDLTHGSFSNTEQQGLHFVKHTLRRWVEQFEQELNLKLFGRNERSRFVEMNMDAVLRGDFATRMTGYATAVQNAIMTPNEVRRRENLPDDDQGDGLMIQGATVPIGTQPATSDGEQNEE